MDDTPRKYAARLSHGELPAEALVLLDHALQILDLQNVKFDSSLTDEDTIPTMTGYLSKVRLQTGRNLKSRIPTWTIHLSASLGTGTRFLEWHDDHWVELLYEYDNGWRLGYVGPHLVTNNEEPLPVALAEESVLAAEREPA